MSDSYWITSHLVVGGNAGTVTGIREHVNSVDAALLALDRGTTAVLPAGAFDLAKEVLLAAGRDEAGAQFAVDSAQGKVQFTDSDLDDWFPGFSGPRPLHPQGEA